MKTTHKITMDLVRSIGKYIAPIDVMQDDKYSRDIQITVTSDGSKLSLSGSTALIRFKKSDGTGGNYDKMPDGKTAYTINENIVTISLAPQVLTAVGKVDIAVAIISGGSYLHTFPLTLNVLKNPGIEPFSTNYVKIAGTLPDSGWTENMYLGTDETGKVIEKTEGFSKMKGIPDSRLYERLTANLPHGNYQIDARENWEDLPGTDEDGRLALLVFWYTRYYYLQIAYSMTTDLVAHRIVRADTHAVHKDWTYHSSKAKEKVYEKIAEITIEKDDDKGIVSFTIDSLGNAFELTDFIVLANAGFANGSKTSLYMNINGKAAIIHASVAGITDSLRRFNIFCRTETDGCKRIELSASNGGIIAYSGQAPITSSFVVPAVADLLGTISKIELFAGSAGTDEWSVGSTFELWGVRV